MTWLSGGRTKAALAVDAGVGEDAAEPDATLDEVGAATEVPGAAAADDAEVFVEGEDVVAGVAGADVDHGVGGDVVAAVAEMDGPVVPVEVVAVDVAVVVAIEGLDGVV
jgi:hypothetical protein